MSFPQVRLEYGGRIGNPPAPLFGKEGCSGDFEENGSIQKIPINPPFPKGEI